MTRGKARELLMQLLFQMEVQKSFEKEQIENYIESYIKGTDNTEYAYRLLGVITQNIKEIDAILNESSNKWSTKRMPKIDLAIARLATAEILYLEDIPDVVSINEAVELAKKFGTENSAKFMNGVLGQIMKNKNGQ